MHTPQFRLTFDSELTHWWFVARRRIIHELIAHILPPSRSTGIVDIGCGTGGNIGSLATHYRCLGVDLSEEAIELARSRYPKVQFICGDAVEGFQAIASEVNLVMLTDVLEHFADDAGMLARLVSIARQGTYFLITVPADRSLWSNHDTSHGHYRRYDRQQLERLWEDLPIKPLMVSYFNSRLYPIVRLIRTCNRLRGKTSGDAGTDLRVPLRLFNWLLKSMFLGERGVLTALLDGSRRQGYHVGVSLIAILRRDQEMPRPHLRIAPCRTTKSANWPAHRPR